MTPKVKEITGEDLYKLKDEINKEQIEARHQQNNVIQKAIVLADEAKTDIGLLNQSFNIMKDDVKEIKQMLKEGFKEIRDTFVTKEEHSVVKDRLDLVYKAFYWLIGLIFSVIIVALLYKSGIGIK